MASNNNAHNNGVIRRQLALNNEIDVRAYGIENNGAAKSSNGVLIITASQRNGVAAIIWHQWRQHRRKRSCA